MADYFLGALKEIERRAQNNILVFSDVLSSRLDVIAQNMEGKKMSDNDYLKLFELYYQRFSKEENKSAMLFCLLRMQQIVFYKEHPERQSEVKNMEFNDSYDMVTKTFLDRKREYYQMTLTHIFQRFILLASAAYIFLLVVCVLLFHIPFLFTFLFLLVAWSLGLVAAKKVGVPYFYQMQIENLSKQVNEIVLKVDQTVF